MRRINKVLLIAPHFIMLKGYFVNISPPLGPAYIAGVLEKSNYDAQILDVVAEAPDYKVDVGFGHVRYGLSYEAIRKRIKELSPDVVGVSCLFSAQFSQVVDICKIAKEVDKNIITVAGGEHVSALPEIALKDGNLDFVIIGEGEYSTLELLNVLNNGGDVSSVDGLGFKRDGRIIVNPKTRFIENLDELPFPARHLLPMQKYLQSTRPQGGTFLRKPNTDIISSRGCTGHCVFCATTKFWGNRYRLRSVLNVIAEMQHLIGEYGVRELHFIDDNLTLNKKHALELFAAMEKLDLVWNTPQGIAVWALDEELLLAMKRAGCYEITFAIESGDQHVVTNIIKKPLLLERVAPLVAYAKKIGLFTRAFFVIGFPGETKEQIRKTFDFARKLNLDSVNFTLATPLPGTELYRLCEEKGYFREGFALDRINYFHGNIKTPDFSPEELEQMLFKNLFLLNANLLFRSPLRFFRKYGLQIRNNPRMVLDYVKLLTSKLVK